MREAVIVSTARTPIGKAFRGAFNNTQAPTLGGHAIREAVSRAGSSPAEVEDVIMGCGAAAGHARASTSRASALLARGPAGHDRRHERRPPVLVRPDGDRDRGQARSSCDGVDDHGRRRPRVDQPGAERAPEPAPRGRSVAAQDQARAVPADDRHRRDRGQALQDQPRGAGRVRAAEPAAHRRRAARGPLRRRDRADHDDQGVVDKETKAVTLRRGHADARTKATAPTPTLAGPRRAQAGARAKATSSPPATPASSPTARPRAW